MKSTIDNFLFQKDPTFFQDMEPNIVDHLREILSIKSIETKIDEMYLFREKSIYYNLSEESRHLIQIIIGELLYEWHKMSNQYTEEVFNMLIKKYNFMEERYWSLFLDYVV